ncbi:MAG: XRE family transcriptional regulator, partial [Muribaculaceae bacterium]|nr:XRE family transcriptional regulator [Muribaculaceae bacterium]
MKEELSPITGRPMVLVTETDSAEFRGEKFFYTHLAYRCQDSGQQFTTTELDEVNVNQVYNAYRQKHGFPFPQEIIQLRNHYGVSASMMSEIMGFGANQW